MSTEEVPSDSSAALPVQEPHNPAAGVRRRPFDLPPLSCRRIYHPGHNLHKRPAGLLAGEKRGRCSSQATGHSSDKSFSSERRNAEGDPRRGGGSRDIVVLRAGDIVPGDSLILKSRDLFVSEASLTGETYPAEKTPGVLDQASPLSRRVNSLFMGTNVVSGTARAVVVQTGTDTEFGRVSQRLKSRETETEFERGIKRFGYLLLEVTMLLVVAIFGINVYLARPIVESFLFSLA